MNLLGQVLHTSFGSYTDQEETSMHLRFFQELFLLSPGSYTDQEKI